MPNILESMFRITGRDKSGPALQSAAANITKTAELTRKGGNPDRPLGRAFRWADRVPSSGYFAPLAHAGQEHLELFRKGERTMHALDQPAVVQHNGGDALRRHTLSGKAPKIAKGVKRGLSDPSILHLSQVHLRRLI